MNEAKTTKTVSIIGAGPAGLMAADYLSDKGFEVTIFERMPTVARKFLMAGKTGLNLTHSEPYERFKQRYYEKSEILSASLDGFTPAQLRKWADDLGAETFVGSSGRVFPKVMKASPLLRAWIAKLERQGVRIKTRHCWLGFSSDGILIEGQGNVVPTKANAYLLAVGGASWPKLGSDGSWTEYLKNEKIKISSFEPANCGFEVQWSNSFKENYAGHAIKTVTATSDIGTTQGEFVITQYGIEGSLIYAHCKALREAQKRNGNVSLKLDLVPNKSLEQLESKIAAINPKASVSNIIRKVTKLSPVKIALLREIHPHLKRCELAKTLKTLEIPLTTTRNLNEAISCAGGVSFEEIDAGFMLSHKPGFFVAGEMLDWEAPTGGYLLTAAMATGLQAARGIETWLSNNQAAN